MTNDARDLLMLFSKLSKNTDWGMYTVREQEIFYALARQAHGKLNPPKRIERPTDEYKPGELSTLTTTARWGKP